MTRYDDNRGDGILGKKFMWEDFLEIDPQETPGLTNRHYFLLPREIRGFALQRRKWGMDQLQSRKWRDRTNSTAETLDIECISECKTFTLSCFPDFVLRSFPFSPAIISQH
jgi:hypothetical protein